MESVERPVVSVAADAFADTEEDGDANRVDVVEPNTLVKVACSSPATSSVMNDEVLRVLRGGARRGGLYRKRIQRVQEVREIEGIRRVQEVRRVQIVKRVRRVRNI